MKNAGEQAAAGPGTARPDGSDGPVYSIRFAVGPERACACGRNQVGSGPVGYRDEEAICDLCLLEGRIELGLVVALVSMIRAVAVYGGNCPAERLDALQYLGAFARVYEHVAARTGPLRIFRLPESEPGGDDP